MIRVIFILTDIHVCAVKRFSMFATYLEFLFLFVDGSILKGFVFYPNYNTNKTESWYFEILFFSEFLM